MYAALRVASHVDYRLVCLSVCLSVRLSCLSVCLSRTGSKQKHRKKTTIVVNFIWAGLAIGLLMCHFDRSKANVTGLQKPQKRCVIMACNYSASVSFVALYKYCIISIIIIIIILYYHLTLRSGWAGCYTCPALRPYQFGPMRNPDVTKGHSDRL